MVKQRVFKRCLDLALVKDFHEFLDFRDYDSYYYESLQSGDVSSLHFISKYFLSIKRRGEYNRFARGVLHSHNSKPVIIPFSNFPIFTNYFKGVTIKQFDTYSCFQPMWGEEHGSIESVHFLNTHTTQQLKKKVEQSNSQKTYYLYKVAQHSGNIFQRIHDEYVAREIENGGENGREK